MITAKQFVIKHTSLPTEIHDKLSNNQKWHIYKGLVETGAFAKFDINTLVKRYGKWLLDEEFN